MNRYLLALGAWVLAVGIMGFATPALACKAAGENKHVGQVTAIDAKAGNFTIRDAETQSLITFTAKADILKSVAADKRIMVSYKEENGKLVAVEVEA
jgi:hypothetical protein